MAVIAIAVLAAVATALLTPVAGWLARRLGAMDRPGPLKVHSEAIPYYGGLAVFVGVGIGEAAARPLLLIPLAAALALGIADDTVDLPPIARLLCELVVGAGVADLVRTGIREPLGYLLVAIVTVLLINAVNMIDGLDALASGVSLAAALGFTLILSGHNVRLAVALAGALVGFLVYNRPPARIYLGDGGAYLIGTALAILLATAWRLHQPVRLGLGGLLCVAYPVAEVACAGIRRLRTHQRVFSGDRDHVYDQLVARGSSTLVAALACIGGQFVLSGLGVGVSVVSPVAGGVTVAAAAGALLVGAGVAGFLGRGRGRARS